MRNLSKTMIGLLLGAATIVSPIAAQAQEWSRGDGGDRGGRQRDGGGRQERGASVGSQERGSWQRGGDRGAMGNGEDRREAIRQARESARAVERPAPAAARADAVNDAGRQRAVRDWSRDRDRSDRGDRDVRNGAGRTDRGDRDGRDWNRDGNRDRDNWNRDRRNDGSRSWTTDRREWNGRDGRDWNRDWRNDRRYSWQDYRRQNRNLYRMPRYDNRHGYSYRRWYPGYRFDAFFYSRNYWISDPYFYRLPPAYGDYRWVRYYDDAVLVDIRTGEIVDIIYSFFF